MNTDVKLERAEPFFQLRDTVADTVMNKDLVPQVVEGVLKAYPFDRH